MNAGPTSMGEVPTSTGCSTMITITKCIYAHACEHYSMIITLHGYWNCECLIFLSIIILLNLMHGSIHNKINSILL